MLHDLKTSDDVFEEWEKAINAYYKNLEAYTIAEVNYNSVLQQQIYLAKDLVGSTLAKDYAKGTKEVCDVLKKLGEADRKIKAGKEKLEFLREINIDRRLKEKATGAITN